MKSNGLRALAACLLCLAALPALSDTGMEKAGPDVSGGKPTSSLADISQKPLYVYTIRGRRDPFVFYEDIDPGRVKEQSSEFTVTELRLVGFIDSGGSKVALFKQGNSGTTYTMRSGRLYSPGDVEMTNVKGEVMKNGQVLLTQGERKVMFNSFRTNP